MEKLTRQQLLLLAQQLRLADTRPFPMQIAEAIQHAIVRLEHLAASPQPPDGDADEHYRRAQQLLMRVAPGATTDRHD